MNRLSSAVYSIGGSWNDPEVNFDRIFDNTAHGSVAAKFPGAGVVGGAAAGTTAGETTTVDVPTPAQSESP